MRVMLLLGSQACLFVYFFFFLPDGSSLSSFS